MINKKITIDGVEYICTPVKEEGTVESKKDYKILSFRATDKGAYPGNIWSRGINNKFGTPIGGIYWCEEDSMLDSVKSGNLEIYSVEYLHTGEIFTIGDRVVGNNGIRLFDITGFMDNGYGMTISGSSIHSVEYLKDYKKVDKNPVLFTTEDGVEVKVGDTSYGVETTKDNRISPFQWSKKEYFISTSLDPTVKYFSTKEKAEEHVDMNEKKYSKQDIINAINKITSIKYSMSTIIALNKELTLGL